MKNIRTADFPNILEALVYQGGVCELDISADVTVAGDLNENLFPDFLFPLYFICFKVTE